MQFLLRAILCLGATAFYIYLPGRMTTSPDDNQSVRESPGVFSPFKAHTRARRGVASG